LCGTGGGDAPCQRAVIGDTHDDAPLATHQIALKREECRSTVSHCLSYSWRGAATRFVLPWWHKAAGKGKGQEAFLSTPLYKSNDQATLNPHIRQP
jgi:hypothetical protein